VNIHCFAGGEITIENAGCRMVCDRGRGRIPPRNGSWGANAARGVLSHSREQTDLVKNEFVYNARETVRFLAGKIDNLADSVSTCGSDSHVG
jgi:hypothetical protein